jgi:SMC interacting uncharacterized protein involved in chromosome segregation
MGQINFIRDLIGKKIKFKGLIRGLIEKIEILEDQISFLQSKLGKIRDKIARKLKFDG